MELILGLNRILVVKINVVQKQFWLKITLGQKYLVKKSQCQKKTFVAKTLGSTKDLVKKNDWIQKLFQSKNIESECPPDVWHLIASSPETYLYKFIKIGAVTADMDKYCEVKCCLAKCHRDSKHLSKLVPESLLQSLVNIRSVIPEILLIWTNIVRSNVAWPNVNKIVNICQNWSQKANFKIWSKSGQ